MKAIVIALILILLASCSSDDENIDALKSKIEKKEEFIKSLSNDLAPSQRIPASERNELIELLLEFYHEFPQDELAPVTLDKIHMIYSSTREYQKSADYGDTLLDNYPNWLSRP